MAEPGWDPERAVKVPENDCPHSSPAFIQASKPKSKGARVCVKNKMQVTSPGTEFPLCETKWTHLVTPQVSPQFYLLWNPEADHTVLGGYW